MTRLICAIWQKSKHVRQLSSSLHVHVPYSTTQIMQMIYHVKLFSAKRLSSPICVAPGLKHYKALYFYLNKTLAHHLHRITCVTVILRENTESHLERTLRPIRA